MKLKYGVVFMVFALASCMSMSDVTLSDENMKFEQDSGVRIAIVLRGLYSMTDEFRDKDYSAFMNKIMDGEVTFFLEKNVDYRAKISIKDNKYEIYIKDFNIFENEAKWVYLNSLISMVVKLDVVTNSHTEPNLIAQHFERTLKMYEGMGDQSSLANDEWVNNKQFIIGKDEIR